MASHLNHEVKQEAEVSNIAILKELKLFFMSKQYKNSGSQDCERYNSVLEAHQAILVYDEDEKLHKLWVNDDPLEWKDAIKIISKMIESLQLSNAQGAGETRNASRSVVTSHCSSVKASTERDFVAIEGGIIARGSVRVGGDDTVINNPVYNINNEPALLDEATLDFKEKQVLRQLKASYLESVYASISGIFGPSLQLEGQYINLQMLCIDLKTKKMEETKESKDSVEAKTKRYKKYQDARMTSAEDLFGDKRAIKIENLFKPFGELFDDKEFQAVNNPDEAARLLLVQGRAGIGKTTFVRYVAHQWSKGQLYANYTWVFTLTLRKLHLLSGTHQLSLSEWVRHSQFSDWNQKEFEALWRQRVKPAIHEKKVLLILDGYDEVPESHPCQSILKDLFITDGVYSNLSLLITTRPSAMDITAQRRNLEIIGFTNENIAQYIQTYFSESSDKALVFNLTEVLCKQPIIWANAHIPLNLNLLCGILENAIKKANMEGLTQGLAQLSSMTRMYQVMERKLYERSYGRHDIGLHKAGRRLIRTQIDFINHYQKERIFLGKLAFQSFRAECLIIPMETVGAVLKAYVDEQMIEGSKQNIQQEKEKLAEVFFENVCGLGLIKPVLDTNDLSQTEQDYEFLHLTFQEYYTAIHLAEGLSSEIPQIKTDVEKVVLEEKYNPRWQIVWWFVAGLLRENTSVYGNYLQQLQGQCNGKMLTGDIFQHYELSLLTRCVDEGMESSNQEVIQSIVERLQRNFVTFYETEKNVKKSLTCDISPSFNMSFFRNLELTNSPFFSACKISLNLCMSEKHDLYTLIQASSEDKGKDFLLEWAGRIQVVTPMVLSTLEKLLMDEKDSMHGTVAYKVRQLNSDIVREKVLDMLVELFRDGRSEARRFALETVGKIGSYARTPKMLDALADVLVDKDRDVRRMAVETVCLLSGNEVSHAYPCHSAVLAKALGSVRVSNRNLVFTGTPKILDTLAGLLEERDIKMCFAAAVAVWGLRGSPMPERVLNALEDLMTCEDQYWRQFAIIVVGDMGVAAVTPKILDALGRLMVSENEISVSARIAVSKIGDIAITPKVLDALAKLLTDERIYVRCETAQAVGKLGALAATEKILNALIKLLIDKENDVRHSAIKALICLGTVATTPKMQEALALLFGHENYEIRCEATSPFNYFEVRIMAPQMFDVLIKAFEDEDLGIQINARRVVLRLIKVGALVATPQLLGVLAKLLAHESSKVRIGAAQVIVKLDKTAEAPKMLDTLLGLIADEDSDIRCNAISVLGQLDKIAITPKVLNALVKLFEDKDPKVRCSVARSVAALEPIVTLEVWGALENLLRDRECSQVRHAAMAALFKIGNTSAMPEMLNTLLELLKDKDNSIRCAATRTLGELDSAIVTSEMLDALTDLLSTQESEVRRCAIEVAAKFGVIAATPKMLDLVANMSTMKDSDMRSTAAMVVSNLGSAVTPKLLDMLVSLLTDENKYVRRNAAMALGNLSSAATPKVLSSLRGVSAIESETYRAATEAINKLLNVPVTPQFLHQLLDEYSLSNNAKALSFFGVHINTAFPLMPSFWAENASHPNSLAFVSYTLAAAYLNSRISCRIDFDKEVELAGYYMRGFVEKSPYGFLITEKQAEILPRLTSLIIEQLSKTGKLDIEGLKIHFPKWGTISQELSSNYRECLAKESRKIKMHLPRNPEDVLEKKSSGILTPQYHRAIMSIAKLSTGIKKEEGEQYSAKTKIAATLINQSKQTNIAFNGESSKVNNNDGNAFLKRLDSSYKYWEPDIACVLRQYKKLEYFQNTEILDVTSNLMSERHQASPGERLNQGKHSGKAIVFGVFNVGNWHWTAFCILTEPGKTIMLYKDSMGREPPKALVESTEEIFGAGTQIKYHTIGQQTDCTSCGIFALENLRIMASRLNSREKNSFIQEFERASDFCTQNRAKYLREEEFAKARVLSEYEWLENEETYKLWKKMVRDNHHPEVEQIVKILKNSELKEQNESDIMALKDTEILPATGKIGVEIFIPPNQHTNQCHYQYRLLFNNLTREQISIYLRNAFGFEYANELRQTNENIYALEIDSNRLNCIRKCALVADKPKIFDKSIFLDTIYSKLMVLNAEGKQAIQDTLREFNILLTQPSQQARDPRP